MLSVAKYIGCLERIFHSRVRQTKCAAHESGLVVDLMIAKKKEPSEDMILCVGVSV